MIESSKQKQNTRFYSLTPAAALPVSIALRRRVSNMRNPNVDKMIIAILQDDDYRQVVEELNRNGFYVTVLESSGGFLKKASATIMIGLNHEDLQEALELLKQYGKRTEMGYQPATTTVGMAVSPMPVPPVPIPMSCGGIVLFVLDVTQYGRF